MAQRRCVALLSFLVSVEAWSGVNVGVVLDTQRAASAVIETTGGTLIATAANGTVFTLTVPANSLLSSERITMTPLAQVDRLPFSGGLIAGVQFEPSGLRLFKPVRLTIATPTPVPPEVITPIAWHEAGRDLYLYPLLLDLNTIAFDLSHFSGIGVGNGTDAERQAQLARSPCDAEAAVTQRIGFLVQQEFFRQRYGMPGETIEFYGQVLEILDGYYTNTVKPALDAALRSQDEDLMWSAITQAIGLRDQLVDILNPEDPFVVAVHDSINDFAKKAAQILSDKAFNRCVSQHKPEELLTLLRAERLVQNLGLQVDLNTQQKLDQCGSFELVFDSLLVRDVGSRAGQITESMHATSTVPIHLVSPDVETTGTAVLAYDYKLVINLPGCSLTNAHGTDDVFNVLEFHPDLNVKKAEDLCAKRRAASHGPPAESTPAQNESKFVLVSMTIDPGHPTESSGSIVCGYSPPVSVPVAGFVITFRTFHQNEAVGSAYKITDWSPGTGGALIARKVYQQDFSSAGGIVGTLREVTTLDLFHRPNP